MVNNFIKKIRDLDNGNCLKKSEVIEFVALLNEHTTNELIEKIRDDIDAQIRIKDSLENALPSKNTESDIKNKMLDIIFVLNDISQQIINTCEDNKNNSVGASVLSDHESRLIVLKKDLQEISKKIQDLESIKLLQKDLEESNQNLTKANKKINDATKQSKEILNQSIEILGIFVAIITIFIGGFSEIASFGAIDNLNTYKFFLYIIVTGHIIGDLIFMFVYMLGRITNKTISASCVGYSKMPDKDDTVENKCQNCCYKSTETCKQYATNKEYCTLARKLRYKYPYIYYTNLVSIVAEAFLCVGWLFSDEILTIKSVFWGKTSIIVIVAILAYMIVKKSLPKIKKFL